MTIEEDLELALRAEAARVDPPVADLVDGALARGRERRRLRRARFAVGAAALTLVAGAGTVVAVPFLGADEPAAPAADAPPVATAPPPADPVASAALDPDAVLDAVAGLLPPGEISATRAGGEDEPTAWFEFSYDDGDGASWMLGSVAVGTPAQTPACPVIVNGGSCELRTLDDGTVLVLMAGPYYPQPDREPDRLHWSAYAVAPSGLQVVLGEMNTPTEKQSEPTRDAPPLSLDQLAAIVTDGVWAELTSGVPAPEPPDPAPVETTDEARALAAALGPGWRADGDGAQPGADLVAGLPSGYTAGWATLLTFGPELTLEQHCEAGEEKGSVNEACVTASAPDGELVHLQWGGTVSEGPYAQNSLEDRVAVLVADDEGRLVRVNLWVAEPAESSTPERRAEARAWLGEQVGDLARAATAAAAEHTG